MVSDGLAKRMGRGFIRFFNFLFSDSPDYRRLDKRIHDLETYFMDELHLMDDRISHTLEKLSSRESVRKSRAKKKQLNTEEEKKGGIITLGDE